MKMEPKVALYRYSLKMTRHTKNLQHLIRVTLKYLMNMRETLKITQQIIRIYLDLTDIKNYQRMAS